MCFDMTSKAQATKEKKTDKLDSIKIKNFCASKDTISPDSCGSVDWMSSPNPPK